MMMQMIRIVGMIGLDDGRRMIGLDDGRMHHRLYHSGQHHRLDDVMRHSMHHSGALMRDCRGQMHYLGHMQWLHVVMNQWILRIMMMMAMQVARTCRGQCAQQQQREELGEASGGTVTE